MSMNLLNGYTGAYGSVDLGCAESTELYAIRRGAVPYLGVFAYTGGSVQLMAQRNLTGCGGITIGVPLGAVYHDGTYVYAAGSAGTPAPNDNFLWAFQYTGGSLYTKGVHKAGRTAGSTGVATTLSAVGGDGTYVYRVAYNETGYGSQLNVKALTFNGSSFSHHGSASVFSGSDVLVSAWVYHDGTYLHVAAKSNNVKGIKAFTFNGSTFTTAGSITTPSSGLGGDGTYLYTVQSNNLVAYSFNGSSYVNVGTPYAIGGSAGKIVCSGGKIYVAPLLGNTATVFTFDGSVFTVDDTATIPAALAGGPVSFVPGPDCTWVTSYDNSGSRGGVWAFEGTPVSIPTAEFDLSKTSGYTPLSVRFSDLSTSVSPIISWVWSFGDGTISTNQNPTHTYAHPGVYTVTLTVMNAEGNYDTETKTSLIRVALGTPTLSTYDRAPPATDDILAQMPNTGDGDVNLHVHGVRYYISNTAGSPPKSGFRRPAGPSLIFD